MEKMRMTSPDTASMNRTRLAALADLFPGCITETRDASGRLKQAVNMETLQTLLTGLSAEGPEAYTFSWVGKRAAMAEAARPIRKTLRPLTPPSKDWDHTENLYIEGDNLDALKLLQESYLGKVKMIYIDPPYNTGHDFIYKDKFRMDEKDYAAQTELFDEEGNKQFAENSDSNPRFHSDWCSMMYPRLLLARNLLTDDGVIFISIDDNELVNLIKICDEIFGETNKIGVITVQSNPRGSQSSKYLSNVHEYLIMYSKSSINLTLKGIAKDEESLNEFSLTEDTGRKYRLLGLRQRGGAWRREDRPKMYFPIYVNPQTGDISLKKDKIHSIEVFPKRPSGELSRWTWSKTKILQNKSMIIGKQINRKSEVNAWDIFRKDYMDKDNGEEKTAKVKTIWIEKDTNYQNAKAEIKELFGNSEMFDFPKPTYIVKKLMAMLFSSPDDIILDFFSGSATTAHAVMQLNAEDGGHRKFIMVQLPEACDEKSEAYKAGYRTICDIGKERIRRAGEKVQKEHPEAKLDTGFRVFRVDSTNMEDVYYSAGDYAQEALAGLTSNIKPDRSALNVFFGCVLDWGLPLDRPYETEEIAGYAVHNYDHGALLACFADAVSEELVRAMAQRQPLRAVFRDSSFPDSPAKINAEEIFKMYSPLTKIKVI